jgi:hypothetical protein
MPDFALDIAALRKIAGLSTTSNFLGDTDTQTPTNKTMSASTNTFSNLIVYPNVKRIGIWQGPNISAGGFFGILGQAASSGTFTTPTMVIADGTCSRIDTGATQNTLAVARTSALVTARGFNPNLFCRFRINQTDQNCRIFIGFKASSSMPNSDDPLNAIAGFALGTISTNTNYQIFNDSGSGATTVTSTGTAIDTAIHTIQLQADDTNTRWGWSLDGGSMTYISTAIPSQTAGLSYIFGIVNSGVAASKTLDHFYTHVTADK